MPELIYPGGLHMLELAMLNIVEVEWSEGVMHAWEKA
ncbi:hypothetical protein GKR41_00214 [Candidatus Vallotia lariciata]|nr:hypothetical protein GKR41_00214 [Candidatus Vallotia lariciata]